MEENLLNEIENFASIKYLDDVTNSETCCDEDGQVRACHHGLYRTPVMFHLG